MTNWIKCSDRLPERQKCVLGLTEDRCIYVVTQCDWDDVCDDWHCMPQNNESIFAFDELTHWCELPEPPEAEG